MQYNRCLNEVKPITKTTCNCTFWKYLFACIVETLLLITDTTVFDCHFTNLESSAYLLNQIQTFSIIHPVDVNPNQAFSARRSRKNKQKDLVERINNGHI